MATNPRPETGTAWKASGEHNFGTLAFGRIRRIGSRVEELTMARKSSGSLASKWDALVVKQKEFDRVLKELQIAWYVYGVEFGMRVCSELIPEHGAGEKRKRARPQRAHKVNAPHGHAELVAPKAAARNVIRKISQRPTSRPRPAAGKKRASAR